MISERMAYIIYEKSKEHRKMWDWIVKKIESYDGIEKEFFKKYERIEKLKEAYILEHDEMHNKIREFRECFECDKKIDSCSICPFEFSKIGLVEDFSIDIEFNFKIEDYNKVLEYARTIRDLTIKGKYKL